MEYTSVKIYGIFYYRCFLSPFSSDIVTLNIWKEKVPIKYFTMFKRKMNTSSCSLHKFAYANVDENCRATLLTSETWNKNLSLRNFNFSNYSATYIMRCTGVFIKTGLYQIFKCMSPRIASIFRYSDNSNFELFYTYIVTASFYVIWYNYWKYE